MSPEFGVTDKGIKAQTGFPGSAAGRDCRKTELGLIVLPLALVSVHRELTSLCKQKLPTSFLRVPRAGRRSDHVDSWKGLQEDLGLWVPGWLTKPHLFLNTHPQTGQTGCATRVTSKQNLCTPNLVIYAWESRTVKKAERQRIDAFEWWCWSAGSHHGRSHP